MSKFEKLYAEIMSGRSDANLDFSDLCKFVKHFGYVERVKGGHHVFIHIDRPELIDLQRFGNKAKPYQVKQVRNILQKYEETI